MAIFVWCEPMTCMHVIIIITLCLKEDTMFFHSIDYSYCQKIKEWMCSWPMHLLNKRAHTHIFHVTMIWNILHLIYKKVKFIIMKLTCRKRCQVIFILIVYCLLGMKWKFRINFKFSIFTIEITYISYT
jgi:hypothetical protein